MSDPLHNLPQGITEDDLLALVESDLGDTRGAGLRRVSDGGAGPQPMSEHRLTAVRAALAARPDLLQLLDQMRSDRGALAAIEPARAPGGLVAAAVSTAHRQLLAADIVEPEVTTLRVSSVHPQRRPGVIATIAELLSSSTLARGLAVAAGFSLAAGVLLWGVLAIVAGISHPVHLADNNAQPGAPTTLDGGSGAAISPDETRLAGQTDTPDIEPAGNNPTALAANDNPIDDGLAGPALEPFPTAQAMDAQHALALAREGRLAVRVRTGSADIALARVESLRRQSQGEGVIWRTLPADVSGPILASIAPPSGALPPRQGPSAPTIASDNPDDNNRPSANHAPLPHLPGSTTGILAAAYDLQLPPSGTTLESLRRALTRDRFQVAEFVELPEPVEAEPPLDARAMFWWDQPPSAWEKKIRVPVLIETVQ